MMKKFKFNLNLIRHRWSDSRGFRSKSSDLKLWSSDRTKLFGRTYLNQTSECCVHEVRNASAWTAAFVVARVGTLQRIAVEDRHVNTPTSREAERAEHQEPVQQVNAHFETSFGSSMALAVEGRFKRT